jgi:hypothetical protein
MQHRCMEPGSSQEARPSIAVELVPTRMRNSQLSSGRHSTGPGQCSAVLELCLLLAITSKHNCPGRFR